MKESSISREHAFQILTEVGIEDNYDPMNDYYVVTTDDGVEMLVVGGMDCPDAVNCSSMSWLGSR